MNTLAKKVTPDGQILSHPDNVKIITVAFHRDRLIAALTIFEAQPERFVWDKGACWLMGGVLQGTPIGKGPGSKLVRHWGLTVPAPPSPPLSEPMRQGDVPTAAVWGSFPSADRAAVARMRGEGQRRLERRRDMG